MVAPQKKNTSMKIQTLRPLTFSHTEPATILPVGEYNVLDYNPLGYWIMRKGHEDLFIPEADARPWLMPEEPEYRTLQIGEIILEGDEADAPDGWAKVPPSQLGKRYLNPARTVRRKVQSTNDRNFERAEQLKKLREEKDDLNRTLEQANNTNVDLLNEVDTLRHWKKGALTVLDEWDKVAEFAQNHPSGMLGQKYQDIVLRLLREGDAWKETAERHCCNKEFYKSIVEQIGKLFGRDAHISDDGSVQQDVLALKVYPLVKSLVEQAGYRLLENGELIQEGDEYHSGGQWKFHTDLRGGKYSDKVFITRRKLAAVKPEEVTYRLLNVGEITQAGDEIFWGGEWKPSAIGLIISPMNKPGRRKITP